MLIRQRFPRQKSETIDSPKFYPARILRYTVFHEVIIDTYYEVQEVIKYIHVNGRHIAYHVQAAVLCDIIKRRCKFIDTFLMFQWNTERKRKIKKDEKKQ